MLAQAQDRAQGQLGAPIQGGGAAMSQQHGADSLAALLLRLVADVPPELQASVLRGVEPLPEDLPRLLRGASAAAPAPALAGSRPTATAATTSTMPLAAVMELQKVRWTAGFPHCQQACTGLEGPAAGVHGSSLLGRHGQAAVFLYAYARLGVLGAQVPEGEGWLRRVNASQLGVKGRVACNGFGQ